MQVRQFLRYRATRGLTAHLTRRNPANAYVKAAGPNPLTHFYAQVAATYLLQLLLARG